MVRPYRRRPRARIPSLDRQRCRPRRYRYRDRRPCCRRPFRLETVVARPAGEMSVPPPPESMFAEAFPVITSALLVPVTFSIFASEVKPLAVPAARSTVTPELVAE